MTTREADRIIQKAKSVTVRSTEYGEVFTALFVRRDRHNIYAAGGGVFDRRDLSLGV